MQLVEHSSQTSLSSFLCGHSTLLLLQSDRGRDAILGVINAEFVEDFLLLLGIVRKPDLVHALQIRYDLVVYFGLRVFFEEVLQCLDALAYFVHEDFAGCEVVGGDDVGRSDGLDLAEILDGLVVVCIEDADEALVDQIGYD